MLQNAAFHQGLHCDFRLKQSSGTGLEVHLNWEILTCNPLYVWFMVSNQVEEFISIQRVRYLGIKDDTMG